MKQRKWIGLAVVSTALLAIASLVAEDSYIAERFEKRNFDDEGVLETLITGDKAIIPLKGYTHLVTIENLKIQHYRDKKVNVTITSERCKYDKKENTAASNFPVRIEGDGIVITGDNFKYNGKEQSMRILKGARTVIEKKQGHALLNQKPVLPKPKPKPAVKKVAPPKIIPSTPPAPSSPAPSPSSPPPSPAPAAGGAA